MAAVPDRQLTLFRGQPVGARRRALAALFGGVLGVETGPLGRGPWQAVAFFGPDGRCVAGLEVAMLPLILDGVAGAAAAIRSVAVDPGWRGQGLFRRIMTEALAWADAQTDGPALLFTEEPGLYNRFGFRTLVQHAFAGSPPPAERAAPVRKLDRAAAAALVRALAPHRGPVSHRVALVVDPDLIVAKLAEGAWEVARLATPDTAIVHRGDGDELILADIVGADIPSLAIILGALGAHPRRVRVMFPPDRLGWNGVPEPEDAGLMIRGATPPAMARPFMLPPTAEF